MNLAALVVTGMMGLAAVATEPSVRSNGQQTVKLMPDTMEMTMDVQASDAQFDKALATIQKKYADVEKALRGLASAPADLKSDGPWMGAVASADQNAMLGRQVMFLDSASATPAPSGDDGKVTLSMTVTAKWKLTAREGLALLKETAALQEAVRAALPKPPDVAASEEDVEAMLAAARQTGESGEPPGTPHFSFTAAIPADKAAEARAQAFKKARAEAESLAQAAGMKLGALMSLSGDVSSSMSDDAYLYLGVRRYAPEPEDVVRSPQARDLTFVARVQTEFSLAPAQ